LNIDFLFFEDNTCYFSAMRSRPNRRLWIEINKKGRVIFGPAFDLWKLDMDFLVKLPRMITKKY
jgi:hypothetical protein